MVRKAALKQECQPGCLTSSPLVTFEEGIDGYSRYTCTLFWLKLYIQDSQYFEKTPEICFSMRVEVKEYIPPHFSL
jgi:hypothetical protein